MTTAESRLRSIWATPPGLSGWFSAVNHRAIGARFIAIAFAFFVLGGLQALVMRLQLAGPGMDVLGPDAFNQFFTMHGTTMMFLFLVPMLEGLAIYLVPLMLGARDMPFPRLNAFGFWAFAFGGILLYSSFLAGEAPDSGWFAYTPLSGPEFSPGRNLDFWLLGVTFIEISGIVAAVELVVLILKQRAPGMSLHRIPLFVWSILAASVMILFAFPAVVTASVLLELDRKFGTQFYQAAGGGDPVLWQHLFWIFGHPEVYIQLLPAVGIVSTIVPVAVRRPIVGYGLIVASTVAIAALSFGVWVHHMFAVGLLLIPLAFFGAASQMFAIPNGIQIFAWIATIWHGKARWNAHFMFVLGFLVLFVLGGITGIMVAVVPFDWQVHDTYFVVAHFHYVLLGGSVFPVFGALHYWIPKMTGRMLNEAAGHLTFWLMFIGFNVTFFPMHLLGMWGMPRRVYTFLPDLGWDGLNLLATVGAFGLAAGVLLFLVNFFWSLKFGRVAGPNPWGGSTLEWAADSPPEQYNFRHLPIVHARDPLWEPEGSGCAWPEAEEMGDALAEPRGTFRETWTTSVVDARPEHVIRLPGPTYWPLVLAFGVFLMLLAFLFDTPLNTTSVFALGLATAVPGIVGWHWPQGDDGPRRDEPSRPAASPSWLGMLMGLTAIGSVVVFLVFAYFFLRMGAAAWPMEGLPSPNLLIGGVAAVLLAVSTACVAGAERKLKQEADDQISTLMAGALVLAFALVSVVTWELLRQPFSHQTNAYASLVITLPGLYLLLLLSGMLWLGVLLVHQVLGHAMARRRLAVQIFALYWYFLAGAGLLILATVYLSPHLWP
ncbi:MAG: cytochrome c oxidase subunit I [Dehalococcoidia bacterium]